MNPFFSIIIPTYNSAKHLESCLNSILNQTFNNYEIIIVDGMSEDETCNIAMRKKDNRLKVISDKDNGIYDAMNKGIIRSIGQWLYFLGSDDTLFDNRVLEDVERMIGKTKRKIIYGDVKILGDTSWATNGRVYDGQFDISKLIKKNICHQGIFYNTTFIRDEIGYFNIKYRVCADWDFNMRCWGKTKFRYFKRTMALFTAGGISTLNVDDPNFKTDFEKNVIGYFGKNIEIVSKPSILNRLKSFNSKRSKY